MAYLAPSDLRAAALSGGQIAELRTLDMLRGSLPNDYTVYHSVHWSREWRSVPAFGEVDFIVVNSAGAALVIEQKSGALEETAGEWLKTTATRARTSRYKCTGRLMAFVTNTAASMAAASRSS
jgi:hypothetical protein